mgnify:CR=1 FL=1
MKYVFGPVPSRRLGLSLPEDIVVFGVGVANVVDFLVSAQASNMAGAAVNVTGGQEMR